MAAPATSPLVTEEFLRAEMARQTAHLEASIDAITERMRAEIWRAMYLSVGVTAAIAGLALAIACWVV